MAKHGVFVSQKATGVTSPIVAESGIPFVIGAAPVQSAENPAAAGKPVLVTGWNDFVEQFGYSDDWSSYNLCEFAYSHFQLYAMQPAIFCNLLDPATHKSAVAAADKTVADHRIKLPGEAINDAALVVKAAGGAGSAYVKGTDYSAYYDGGALVIELLSAGACYSAASLSVAYNAVTPASINASAVATGMQSIDLCMAGLGVIPDLIVAPGYSTDTSVAALMATKAAELNGVFECKALIDLPTGTVTSYSGVAAAKASANLVDRNEILCWPKLKLGDKTFFMSTQLAGLMAQVDTDNDGCPYESPSNKNFKMDGLVLADGTEVILTKAQADVVVNAGVVTALNFLASGWVAWGNYTACYPGNADVKDNLIPVSRMFGWIGNTLVKTFWAKLDKPMNRRLIDTVIDTTNIWLNGLVGQGKLLGGRAEYSSDENPVTDLMAGIIRVHLYLTPPSPAQEIDFVLEYDVNYVTAALS